MRSEIRIMPRKAIKLKATNQININSLRMMGALYSVKAAQANVNIPFSLDSNNVTFLRGAPVAQWVKRWPSDLAVPSSISARGEIFSTVNGAPLHTAFHYQPPIVLI